MNFKELGINDNKIKTLKKMGITNPNTYTRTKYRYNKIR